MWTVSGDNQKKHMVLSEDTLLPQPRPPSKMLMLVARQCNPDAKILNGRLTIRLLIGQRLGGRGVPLRTKVLSRNHYVLCDLFFYYISLKTPNQNSVHSSGLKLMFVLVQKKRKRSIHFKALY